jgi:hypothetical protein
MIPKKIFQTWKTKKLSRKFEELVDTWKSHNPDYDFYFHDDEECEVFLLNNFDRKVFSTYKKIIPGAFKADLWRFCILYKFGGFYCDVDTICLNKIDNFVDSKTEFIGVVDLNENCNYTHNLFNSFIGVIPESPIMRFCIDRIIYNVKNNIIDIHPLDFSSCGVLGRSLNNYLGNNETNSFLDKEGIHGKIHLLKLEKQEEYVKDKEGNILFQNKNGNEKINEIYKNECDLNKVVSWFYSKHWIRNKIFI